MNHDKHEIHGRDEIHEISEYRMRIPSPLSADEEALMTRTIGCAIEVHKALGPGFLESIYQKAMCVELEREGVPYAQQVPVRVSYRDVPIAGQRIDLVVGQRIVVELKSIRQLDQIHELQVISYLRAMKLRGGLLINFRVPVLPMGLKRIVL